MRGSCPFFCPRGEVRRRLRYHELSPCERAFPDPKTGDDFLAVTAYHRSAAGVKFSEEDVRPPAVLHAVVDHLLGSVARLTSVSFQDKAAFIEDRLRAVRQEYQVQQCVSDTATRNLERMARFYVACSYRLLQSPAIVLSQVLNYSHLSGCLTTLISTYSARREAKAGVSSLSEAEMWSFHLLLHLDSPALGPLLRRLPQDLLGSECVATSVALGGCWVGQRWCEAIRIATRLPILGRCLVHRLLPRMRYNIFGDMVQASATRHPAASLVRVGAFADVEEVCAFATRIGLGVGTVMAQGGAGAGAEPGAVQLLLFKQTKSLRPMEETVGNLHETQANDSFVLGTGSDRVVAEDWWVNAVGARQKKCG